MNPQDKENFFKLCQEFLETGTPEDRVKHEVFNALVDKDYGLFEFVFRKDDGQIDEEEQKLFDWIKSFRWVNDYKIIERFSPYLELDFPISEDEEKFNQLCKHFLEAGCPEDMVDSYVYSALADKRYGFFEAIFRQYDGTIDPNKQNLFNWIKTTLLNETKQSIKMRFAPFVKS